MAKNKQAEQFELTCEFVAETARAVLIRFENMYGIRGESWVPFSQVHYTDKQAGKIRITPFIAKKLNLL
jgi:hypothetical protein